MDEMIRPLEKQELGPLMEMIGRVVAQMQKNGLVQWDAFYPTEPVFQKDREEGTLYGLFLGEKLAGCAVINKEQPAEYKSLPWQGNGHCFVVHRLAVEPTLQKEGCGGKLLAFAEKLAKNLGVASLRTDTSTENHAMQRLLKKQGYAQVGGSFSLDGMAERGFFLAFEKQMRPIGEEER